MTYAIQTDSTNRINRWEFTKYVPFMLLDQYIIVDMLPEGNLPDYQYIDGEFIYNPLPKEEPAEPTPTLEDRVSALENTVNTTVAEYNTVLQELGVET